MTFIKLLDKHEGLSQSQLVEKTGLTTTTVSKWLRILRTGPDRCVYICRYDKTGPNATGVVARYKFSFILTDVARPRKQTVTEYSRTYRLKRDIREESKLLEKRNG